MSRGLLAISLALLAASIRNDRRRRRERAQAYGAGTLEQEAEQVMASLRLNWQAMSGGRVTYADRKVIRQHAKANLDRLGELFEKADLQR